MHATIIHQLCSRSYSQCVSVYCHSYSYMLIDCSMVDENESVELDIVLNECLYM